LWTKKLDKKWGLMKNIFDHAEGQVPVRAAATVIVLKPAFDGFEVLLLRRSKTSSFASNVWVFPGGGVDQEDLDQSLGDPDRASVVAAVRETQEEAGLRLDPASLVPYCHWTTPEGVSKRYATWFYLSSFDQGLNLVDVEVAEHHSVSEVRVDGQEIVEHQWVSPAEALAQQSRGDIALLPPTYISLLELSRFSDIDVAMAQLRVETFNTILPKSCPDGEAVIMLYPGDAGYETGNPGEQGKRHRFVMSPSEWIYDKTL
jgi:8-oxo-dGTP pyrophosphatase MutT (NUDIX family)